MKNNTIAPIEKYLPSKQRHLQILSESAFRFQRDVVSSFDSLLNTPSCVKRNFRSTVFNNHQTIFARHLSEV